MHRLANKAAIVTGASSGIGCAAAKLFAAEGAKAVLAARRGPELGPLLPTADVALSDREGALRVNLTSAFLAAKYQAPAMSKRQSGSIVFTSTFVGYTVGMPSMAAYAASKSGLIGSSALLVDGGVSISRS